MRSEIPTVVSAAEVFTEQIVLRRPVAEEVFHAGTARHEVALKRVFAVVVQVVFFLTLIVGPTVFAFVAGDPVTGEWTSSLATTHWRPAAALALIH